MNNLHNQLDMAYDISRMELTSLDEQDLEKAGELARQRSRILDQLFTSPGKNNSEEFRDKLLRLQKMQARITLSARKLHKELSEELKRVKTENNRFTGYKKATSVTPLFNPCLNKKG